jgi:hypothetical protein
MHSHLFSPHPSIWELVENGMHFDNNGNAIFINEQIHKNAQATTVLLAYLCRDEYNKVSGLDNAKEISDTLKISHEGNDSTMITKMELVEGELGRFSMKRGEEETKTYNRLKTLVNKIRSYGSTRWTDHDVVRLMLRSFIVIDPHLVNLIRENPRYTKMSPEEILGKLVSVISWPRWMVISWPKLNRINSVLIPTRCVLFFGSLSRKNLQVKRAWLGAIWDGVTD